MVKTEANDRTEWQRDDARSTGVFGISELSCILLVSKVVIG